MKQSIFKITLYLMLLVALSYSGTSQVSLKCYTYENFSSSDCYGCNLKTGHFSGIIVSTEGVKIALHKPIKVTYKASSVFFEDAFGNKFNSQLSRINQNVQTFVSECLKDNTETLYYTSSTNFPLTGKTNTLYVDKSTGAVYVWDGSGHVTSHSTNTSSVFPDSYNQNIRIATAIVRPTIQGDGSVTWSFVDDADHDIIFFTSLSTPNSEILRIGYPTVSKVLSFQVSTDDATYKYGVSAGASVGLSNADIRFSMPFQTRQISSFNGTSWSNTGTVHTSSVTNAGSTIVVDRAAGGFANIESSYSDTYAMYAGTNNRVLRQDPTSIGYFQNKYQLVNPTTGSVETPISGDKLVIYNPNLNVKLNTQTTNTSHQIEKHVYDNSLLPNYFITAIVVI